MTIREDLLLVHRERVDTQLERLFELSGGEVTGPAGSGKTSAVRSWASRTGLADVVWLSIQQRHRDSKVLAADLFDALLPDEAQGLFPDGSDAEGLKGAGTWNLHQQNSKSFVRPAVRPGTFASRKAPYRRWQALRGATSGPFRVDQENAPWEDSEMPTIDLDRGRARLVVEREKLQRELAEVRGERTTDGPIDTLSSDAAQDTTRVETEQPLADATAALRRLDDGSYGYDEGTGEPIDPVRLEAVPTARTNIR